MAFLEKYINYLHLGVKRTQMTSSLELGLVKRLYGLVKLNPSYLVITNKRMQRERDRRRMRENNPGLDETLMR